MATIIATCNCGAKLEVEDHNVLWVSSQFKTFLKAHAICRRTQEPEITIEGPWPNEDSEGNNERT